MRYVNWGVVSRHLARTYFLIKLSFLFSLSLSQLSNRRRFTFLYFNKPRVHERPRIHAQVALILYLPLLVSPLSILVFPGG